MKPILNTSFFRSDSGNEPVREWLKALSATERRIMGEDIKTVQFGWPLGMPLVRHLEGGIWEIRMRLRTPRPELVLQAGSPLQGTGAMR